MSQINSNNAASVADAFGASESAPRNGGTNDAYNDLDIDAFLTLLISELQNQDPLDPMDNSEMVAQIGQIREIGATDALTGTLSSISESQNLVTASGLIGTTVDGLSPEGTRVQGVVDRITVSADPDNGARSVKVHVGDQTMDLRNIREVTPG